MVFWSLCSFLLVELYSCNLRSNLVIPALEKPINFPEDVLERGETMYIPRFYRLARYLIIKLSHNIIILVIFLDQN